ncbi:MAG: 5-nucleotidase [Cryptosporangiaceae bacterium]|nr:5-nucleotidase [Cryptosporangiaceae bacterium]
MEQTRSTRRRYRARHLALPLAAVALFAALPLATSGGAGPRPAWTPLSPVTVAFRQAAPSNTVNATLLGFNDFHGNIDPPLGSGGLVNGTPAGGGEYLATAVRKLRADARKRGEPVLTVGAGDMVGASPLVSAAFHDEPSIETLSALGLQITSVGNHEFDEGTDELLRMQNGGCHPKDGCQDGDGFAGASFKYLSANVVDKQTRAPLFPGYAIRNIGGVKVGFVGLTLKGTPGIVNPAGITKVDFLDEANTANYYAGLLKGKYKVNALVLLVHEGGAQSSTPVPDPSSCQDFAGAITPIVANLRQEYGVVISGHTHRFYSCALPNSSGHNSVVTSAGSAGVLVTDLAVGLDKKTGQFASVSAHNVIAEIGVRNPDGSWQKDAQGNYVRNPALADPAVKRIADKYRKAVAPVANRIVGKITADITATQNPAGESALGDVIADAQLAYTQSAGAQIALMNPGGIRAPLVKDFSPGGEPSGDVTYGESFTVQPFNNLVVTQSVTGQQIKDVLEQQFVGFGGQTSQKILQVSAGLHYSYLSIGEPGKRVFGITVNGAPIDLAASYKVTSNDFLANGGDGFTNLAKGTGRVTAPGFDVDALNSYLGAGAPVPPGPQNRILVVAPPPA